MTDHQKIHLYYVNASEDSESSLAINKGYTVDVIKTEYGKIMIFKKNLLTT